MSERLRALKNHYDELSAMISLDELQAGKLPSQADWNMFLQLLERILWDTRHMQRELTQAATVHGMVVHTMDEKLSEFYNNIAQPNLSLIRDLYIAHHPSGCLEDLLRESENTSHPVTPWIQGTFRSALSYWDETIEADDPRREDVFDFEGTWEIVDSYYFQPDIWRENSHALRPIITSPIGKSIPKPVRSRLSEIYLSFILGNWMAAIAMSRSVLESVILDHAARYRIDPADTENPRWTKKLGKLCLELAYFRPDLADAMDYVVKQGNFIIHPEQGETVLSFPARRAMAIKCIDHVRNVTEKLYKFDK